MSDGWWTINLVSHWSTCFFEFVSFEEGIENLNNLFPVRSDNKPGSDRDKWLGKGEISAKTAHFSALNGPFWGRKRPFKQKEMEPQPQMDRPKKMISSLESRWLGYWWEEPDEQDKPDDWRSMKEMTGYGFKILIQRGNGRNCAGWFDHPAEAGLVCG